MPYSIFALDFNWFSGRVVSEIVGQVFIGKLAIAGIYQTMPFGIDPVIACGNAVSEFSELDTSSWLSEVIVDH